MGRPVGVCVWRLFTARPFHDLPIVGDGRSRVFAAFLLMAAWCPPLSAPAQDTSSPASYRVTFEGTWTTDATPGGLPGGAHFSPLIGAVHNGEVTFWEVGGMASQGVERVAELGVTGTFRREIDGSGHALAVLEKSLPGGGTPQARIDFEVNQEYPLVTLITMIAPSPDWFVGVSALPMLDDGGQWRMNVEVDLYPYDAGTEDGEGFSLSNPATVPQGVITSIRGMGRFSDAPMARLGFECLSGCTALRPPDPVVWNVPLMPSSSDSHGRQGFVRVINRSDEGGEVQVVAVNDMGLRSDPLSLSIGAGETAHFNSDDVEMGNEEKGLSGAAGAGRGDLRLEMTTPLDVEVLAYIRHSDGFLTAMHDTVPGEGDVHRVATFNPGRNKNQKSLLRLINPGTEEAAIAIEGIDDAGNSSDTVRLTLPPGGAGTVSSASLESDEYRDDLELAGDRGVLEGELGAGVGKWRLIVRSDQSLMVMSLLKSPTGHLTNLSTALAMSDGAEF